MLSDRGLNEVMPSMEDAFGIFGVGNSPAGIEDLDGDGDLDFYADAFLGHPWVQANDGTAFFDAPLPLPSLPPPTPDHDFPIVLTLTAADVDGDGLPELFAAGAGFAAYWPNLGSLMFGEPTFLFAEPRDAGALYAVIALADYSADGHLDAAFPPVTLLSWEPGADGIPAPTRRFLGGPDGFVETTPASELVTLAAIATDRDNDGDIDLLATSDRMAPSSFFRNEGGSPPAMVNDATSVGFAQIFGGMGIDARDFNGDSLPDYCVTDVGPPLCFLSDGQGAWYEAGRALRLDAAEPGSSWATTVGWSFELVDIDNDGLIDAAQASAPHTDQARDQPDVRYPDLLWRGESDGTFTDITSTSTFGDPEYDFGLVATDLDENGAIDLLLLGPQRAPRLWMGQCTEGGFVNIELRGPSGLVDALGARVSLVAGSVRETREIYSLRGPAGTPTRLHIGLGTVPLIDQLSIVWPDGEETSMVNIEPNRKITARHPNARPFD